MTRSVWYKYSYIWVTGVFFLLSLIGHWIFAWLAYLDEQALHAAPVIISEFWVQVLRDTLENWQSEFLQLMWQIAGLAFLIYVGSPQSKEGDERKEEKLDAILRKIDPKKGDEIIKRLERKYPKK